MLNKIILLTNSINIVIHMSNLLILLHSLFLEHRNGEILFRFANLQVRVLITMCISALVVIVVSFLTILLSILAPKNKLLKITTSIIAFLLASSVFLLYIRYISNF